MKRRVMGGGDAGISVVGISFGALLFFGMFLCLCFGVGPNVRGLSAWGLASCRVPVLCGCDFVGFLLAEKRMTLLIIRFFS